MKAIDKAKDNGEVTYLRFMLYFTTNCWLTTIKRQHNLLRMQPSREPAVRALFRCNIKAMAIGFKCSVQALPNELEKHFGRALSQHGKTVDTSEKNFHYFLDVAQREKFRLLYKGGLLYQLPWRQFMRGEAVEPVLANSSIIHEQTRANLKGTEKVKDGKFQKDMFKLIEEWAFFVMSMNV